MSDAFSPKPSRVSLYQGILLLVLGVLSITFPFIASIAIEQVFGAFLLIGGGYALAAVLGRKEAGLTHRIVSGFWALLALVTGLLLVFEIYAGMKMLTVLLAFYFAAQGIVTIIAAFRFRGSATMWVMLLSGAVSLVLAGMIFSGFPGTAAWVLGLLFGINLIFTGAFFISMALTSGTRAA
jgi:uncharacterized membrane protein HdeD (DUF308 family)